MQILIYVAGILTLAGVILVLGQLSIMAACVVGGVGFCAMIVFFPAH